jgi:predicted nucleic acid-binding protein
VGPDDVPAGPLAVDTDVFSMVHNRRGRHAEFAPLIEGHPLALPFAVVGELKVGAIRGGLQSTRLHALTAAIRTCVVIPTDARVVDKWAELHARFLNRLKGEGINDLWIASCKGCRSSRTISATLVRSRPSSTTYDSSILTSDTPCITTGD